MKKSLIAILVLSLAGGALFAQGNPGAPNPTGGVMLNIGYSLFAPIGVSVEIFPTSHIGIGGMLNGFFFAAGGGVIWSVNPGGFIRVYFGDPEGTLYLNGGMSYLTLGAAGGGSSGWVEGGLLQFRGGLGFSSIFGKRNQTRLALELGVVYQNLISKYGDSDDFFPILPYFGLSVGRAF